MYGYRQELVLLAEGWIHVTSARIVVGHQTYPVGAISSVTAFTLPAERSSAIIATVLCSLLGLLGFCLAPIVVLIAFACALGAGMYAYSQKTQHGILIATSGMQVRALTSDDYHLVARVCGAINQALAMR